MYFLSLDPVEESFESFERKLSHSDFLVWCQWMRSNNLKSFEFGIFQFVVWIVLLFEFFFRIRIYVQKNRSAAAPGFWLATYCKDWIQNLNSNNQILNRVESFLHSNHAPVDLHSMVLLRLKRHYSSTTLDSSEERRIEHYWRSDSSECLESTSQHERD